MNRRQQLTAPKKTWGGWRVPQGLFFMAIFVSVDR